MKTWMLILLTGFGCSACGDEYENAKNYCQTEECNQLGTCVQGAKGPVCLCYDWALRQGNQCIEKPTPCDSLKCGGHGSCWQQDQEARCFCDEGYELKNNTCVPMADPCQGVTCGGHGRCVNASGNAVCLCDDGYVQSKSSCVPGENPCENVDCNQQGFCALTARNQAACICNSGYVAVGASCQEITDACSGHDCGVGVCVVNDSNEPQCICPEGYREIDHKCVAVRATCDGVTCSGKGVCRVAYGEDSQLSPFCICEQGYDSVVSGGQPDCREDLARSACKNWNCSHQGVCVVDQQGDSGISDGARCVCNEGFHAEGRECIADLDVCLDKCTENGRCIKVEIPSDSRKKYAPKCICDEGYAALGLNCVEKPSSPLPEFMPADLSLVARHPSTYQPYIKGRLLAYAHIDPVTGDIPSVFHHLEQISTILWEHHAKIQAYDAQSRRYILQFDEMLSKEEMLQQRDEIALLTDGDFPLFDVVIEDFIDTPSGLPNDPWEFGHCTDSCWSDNAGGNWFLEALNAPAAWDWTRGGHAAVGIIDFGIQRHVDLDERLKRVNLLDVTPSQEEIDHGTAVAGVIGATGDNGKGLTGLLWSPSIYFCQTDGTFSRFMNCMHWLQDQEVLVINYSANHNWSHLSDEMKPWNLAASQSSNDNEIAAWTREFASLDSRLSLVQSAGNEALSRARLKYAAPAAGIDENGMGLKSRIWIVGSAKSSNDAKADYSNAADFYVVGGDGDCSDATASNNNATCRNITVLQGENRIIGGRYGSSYAAALMTATLGMLRSVGAQKEIGEYMTSVFSTENLSDPFYLNVAQALLKVVNSCAGYAYACGGTHKCDENMRPYGDGLMHFNVIDGECGCTPNCVGKLCGSEDGCGGICAGADYRHCSGDLLSYCDADSRSMKTLSCSTGILPANTYRCGWNEELSRYDCLQELGPGCAVQQCGIDLATGKDCGSCGEKICLNGQCVDSLVNEMRVIPAAGETFIMGTSEEDLERLSSRSEKANAQREEIAHSVHFTHSYRILKHEVTQKEWKDVMGHLPVTLTGDGSTRPVSLVNWYEALAWCNARSELEGLEPCYEMTNCVLTPGTHARYRCESVEFKGVDCKGYRLPTEAEWEFAARMDNRPEVLYGNPEDVKRIAWCESTGVHDIEQKDPIGPGESLYDMLGNVAEWTWDRYDEHYGLTQSGADLLNSEVTDPLGLVSSAGYGTGEAIKHVIKGGAYHQNAEVMRASYRGTSLVGSYHGTTASGSNEARGDVGFRPVRTMTEDEMIEDAH